MDWQRNVIRKLAVKKRIIYFQSIFNSKFLILGACCGGNTVDGCADDIARSQCSSTATHVGGQRCAQSCGACCEDSTCTPRAQTSLNGKPCPSFILGDYKCSKQCGKNREMNLRKYNFNFLKKDLVVVNQIVLITNLNRNVVRKVHSQLVLVMILVVNI